MRKFLYSNLEAIDEPFCEVVADPDSFWGTVNIRLEMYAAKKNFRLIDRYNCNSISLMSSCWPNDDGKLPDLSRLKDFSRIEYISIIGSSYYSKIKIDEKEFHEFLKPFENLKGLIVIGFIVGKFNMSLPNLKKLHYDRRCIQIDDLENKCPELEFLRIDHMKEDLLVLGKLNRLQDFFLYSSKIPTLEHICNFKNLQTLYIEGQRTVIDLSSLNCLQKLETLKVESSKFHLGWDELKLNNIRNIYVKNIETTAVIDNNESLEYFGTSNEPLSITDNTLSRGFVKYERGRYGIGGGGLPKELRK